MTPAEALRLILDQVDYTNRACGPTEMVGAVLPKDVIEICHKALAEPKPARMMAMYDPGHRIGLRNGYWLQKQDDDNWWIGRGEMNLAMKITASVPCGEGGSIDGFVRDFATDIND